MAFAAMADRDSIGEINTTPLIDVMLVLLVMFVITIPAATNSLDVDLPGPCNACDLPAPMTISNRITIDGQDRLFWNGHAIDGGQLLALLRATTAMPVEPELHFEPDAAASYNRSARVLQIIKASGVTNFGFVGNERYRQFGG
ncbi:MAG: biopolymer transporter ExbD [Sphingomonadales bacterium]|nr:biopolymer transporter ExbD [Sphingomonadales bacterium]MBD3774273.1 biopolymer transporter ExbD [Paracoccaceae bacterium]